MKYFVVSDIHSFCEELKHSLRKAGFNKRNKNHTLIVCGDVFDRGSDTIGVYKFLASIPKKRCILIKGNHESLYKELLTKSFPDSYDFSNGTVSAFCQIAGIEEEKLNKYYWMEETHLFGDYEAIQEKLLNVWQQIKVLVQKHPITTWLDSKQWRNYYELDKYIFTHSFIPVAVKEEYIGIPSYRLKAFCCEYRKDWRNALNDAWEAATWVDPIDNFSHGLFKPEAERGKVLVIGHWHTSDFYKRLGGIPTDAQDIYYSKHLIAIDGGVKKDWFLGLTHPQKVLVIDSVDFNKCYNEELKLLEYIDD